MRLKRCGGIELPKDHPEFYNIERHLNRIMYGYDGEKNRIKFYEDIGDSIIIPRYYPILSEVEDLTIEGCDIEINCKIVPRNDRQSKSINTLLDNNSCLLCLEPGSGKTIVAIAVISKFKKRTIIFAHKVKLLDQWKKEILKFTDLSEDDIGKLSTKNYKKILDKKIILCTEHIIPYAIKHDNKEFLQALNNSGIGVAFIDEVHVGIGPEEFSKSSLSLRCKRIYGLSATPARNDGNDDIMEYHVGKTIYIEPEENEILKPIIYMVYFPFGIYGRYKKYLSWGGKFSRSRYLKQATKMDRYIDTTSSIIRKCYDKDRTILVLGERKLTLLELAVRTGIPKEDIGIFIPGTSSKERLSVSDTDDLDEAFHNKRVVFSTYLAARDGNNRETLDCLIHTTPSTNPEQSIGRVQRILSEKRIPLIMDLVDTEGPYVDSTISDKKVAWFVRSAEKRIELYKKHGWKIEYIKL